RHRTKIIQPVSVRHRAEITYVLADLFVIAMEITEDRFELAHDLALERNVHPENAMRRRMLRSQRYFEQLAIEPRAHCCRWPLGWFECLNCRAHSRLRFTDHDSHF